jgi:hypothetical protein
VLSTVFSSLRMRTITVSILGNNILDAAEASAVPFQASWGMYS